MGYFEYYLIAVNVVGFALFAINAWLYNNTPEGQVDSLLTVTCLLGGSVGILLSMILIDPKAVKANMMSRVFIACVLVIQIVILLVIKGHVAGELTLAVADFFSAHKLLVAYLIIINVVTLCAYAVDKIAAIERKSRIRNITLLGLAFIGGSLGALIAMYVFRHKTKKDYYTVGVPLIILMQIVVIAYAMNAAW